MINVSAIRGLRGVFASLDVDVEFVEKFFF